MSAAAPGLGEITRVFARIGILSFGGPAAQIALLHRDLVEERGWIEERDFLAALSFCMLLPGPEAMQLATYTGWRVRGTLGGIIAGGLFVLPGALVVLALSIAYAHVGDLAVVQALFTGVQAAVVVIVVEALLRVAKRALKTRLAWIIAGAAFLGIFALGLPFPLIIALAAGAGTLFAPPAPAAPSPPASVAATVRTAAVWAALWLAPLGLLVATGGFLAEIASFFSQLALFTFGGAYAVLAWMADTAVNTKNWLTPEQMVDGLGLAETTPGPLILVTEFVGFQAGFAKGGLLVGLASAGVTLWMTFLPSFLFVFAGAPWTLWIAGKPRLAAALSGVTAAVTGVILNLTLWFAAHVFFARVGRWDAGPLSLVAPDWTSLDPVSCLVAALAALLLFGAHRGLPLVLALSAAAGFVLAHLTST